jgi:hypothetical protein
MFTVVKKYLQTKLFSRCSRHACSPLLERVVVKLSSGHPVYGNSALLYIGMAVAQEFGKRIPQEQKWLDNRDAGRVEVYVGRLIGKKTPDDATWERHIRLAERLLIHAHSPPMNMQKGLGKFAADLRPIHVLHWSYYRDLLPEVSGAYWANVDEDFDHYQTFG